MLIVINYKKDEGKYTLFTASLDLGDSKKNREKKKKPHEILGSRSAVIFSGSVLWSHAWRTNR